ncbi:uncharacterized protein DFL_004420 [Arthrobotrys flagrans]|uniref:Uncharacterized protein n=1 Tax=Arthrobotrys flagrans TaxID=97331 RepID=A0A437A4R9_ARTFL|nr:hypothetical protein DFL_004420 [Arthrobotrys flagrans]
MPRCNKLPTAEIQASVSTLCLDAFSRYKAAKAAGVLGETELNILYNEFMTLSSEMNMLTLQVSGLRSKSPKEGRPKAQLWLVAKREMRFPRCPSAIMTGNR